MRMKTLDKNKYEFVIDKKLEKILLYPREISLINIFSDNSFPFNQGDLKSWNQRNINLNEFRKCLKSNSKECSINGNYENELFYISNEKQTKLGENIFDEEINGNNIYINRIVKRNK